MTDLTDPSELQGKKLVDPAGAEIGEAREIYLEHNSDLPAFALVKTGLFGSKHTFVPLSGASLDGPRIWVTVDKGQVRGAPKIEPDDELSPQQEGEVYRHYGMESPGEGQTEQQPGERETEQQPGEGQTEQPADRPEAGRTEADTGTGEAFARGGASDERLPRLRRHVVTEDIQVTVPVQREEVRVEPPEASAPAQEPTPIQQGGASQESAAAQQGAPARQDTAVNEGTPAQEGVPERTEQPGADDPARTPDRSK